jgi:hypothetical protein
MKKTSKKSAKKSVKKTTKEKQKPLKSDWIKRRRDFTIKKNDPVREDRIEMTIVVDAYGRDETMLGWFYSLEMALDGKYVRCRCQKTRSMSPLKVDDEVEIIGMPPEEDCEGEMFVMVNHSDKKIAVPLSQLQPTEGDRDAVTIIEDWLYWCLMGYDFG